MKRKISLSKYAKIDVRANPRSGIFIDILFMITGMLLALALCVILFEWFKDMGLISVGKEQMHMAGGSINNEELIINNKIGVMTEVGDRVISNAEVTAGIIFVKGGKGYGYIGQKNVSLMKLEIVPNEKAELRDLVFDFNGYANSSDLVDLQLYLNKKLIGNIVFYEGQGIFEDIGLKMEAKKTYALEVKGTISNGAKSSDRIGIGLKDADSITLVDEKVERLQLKADWPLWGDFVSVIGEKL